MNEQVHKIYEQRLIAFIDILGWSEACKTESAKLTAATQAIQNAANDFSSTSKNEIKRIDNIKINPIYLNVQVGAFSDSFAISMPAGYGYRIISGASEVCRNLLHLGFLTRGAITVGDLHHIDNQIFGPALIEAVRLEKEAVYPRLICSPKLIDHLEKFPKEIEHIVVDHLGRRIANLFEVLGKSSTGQPLNHRQIYKITDIEKIIEDKLQQHTKDRSDKRVEKWRYMRDVMQVMFKGNY